MAQRLPAAAMARAQPPLPAPDQVPTSNRFRGSRWEITEDRAWWWFVTRFRRAIEESRFLDCLRRIDDHEVLLLVYDLDCYEGLCLRYLNGRGPRPAPIVEYLSAGREGWGEFAE